MYFPSSITAVDVEEKEVDEKRAQSAASTRPGTSNTRTGMKKN